MPSSNAKWEIQIHPPRGKEWLVAYFFEKNPLQGYDLPYTLSQDFLVTGKIDELHYIKTLPWETAEKSILELSTPDANPAQNVSEKWTKSVWGYTT